MVEFLSFNFGRFLMRSFLSSSVICLYVALLNLRIIYTNLIYVIYIKEAHKLKLCVLLFDNDSILSISKNLNICKIFENCYSFSNTEK